MSQFARRQSRALLVLLAVMAIALSACGSSGSTAAPGGNGPAATNAGNNPVVTNAAGGGGDLSGAQGAFASVNSYKFSMTLAGGPYGGMVSMLGGAGGTGNAAFTITGTVTVKPEKASDIMLGGMHMITVGGFDYTDLGTGQFVKSASSGTSTADAFSPSSMFSGIGSTSGYNKVGSEKKNGLDADHYQAGASALAGLGSSMGVKNATWTGDVWIAKDGGYPVSTAIFAKTSDGTVAFQMTFDITNINDASNKVAAPTNIMPGV